MSIEQAVLPLNNQRYTISFPEGYPDEIPGPIILALHFAGHGTPFYGRIILEQLVEPALRELGAVIVAPDCTAESWSDPQSEADVLSLLDFVSNHYVLDTKRLIVCGYSMGGNGAWYLAARNPDRFSAAVIMSGWPPPEIGQVEWRVPVYVIHSRDDEFMPIEPTQFAVNTLVDRGAQVEFSILDGVTHFETYRFIAPLSAALPWLERVWQAGSR